MPVGTVRVPRIELGTSGPFGDGPEIQQALSRDWAEGVMVRRPWCLRLAPCPAAPHCPGRSVTIGYAQVLAIALIVGEEEEFVLLDRAAQRCAEVIALELRNARGVKVVARVEVRVAQELIGRAVNSVGPRSGDDGDLCAGPLAVRCGVGVGDDVELAHRLYAEQLAAGPARRYVDQRRAGVLDAVQQVEIVLRPPA